MKIQSQFKDYYDYVAHIYGGGDPKIVYVRNRIGKMEHFSTDHIVRGINVEQKGLPTYFYDDELRKRFKHTAKWLAIAGKLYLILTKVSTFPEPPVPEDWHVLSEDMHPEIWKDLHERRWAFNAKREYIGVQLPEVLELSRKVNAPVFTFDYSYRRDVANVDGDVPILGNMGIPALIPAEQMYQDLSYFIGNTMKLSPDGMPPTTMTDKEKIAAAGFDLKQSFRHRV